MQESYRWLKFTSSSLALAILVSACSSDDDTANPMQKQTVEDALQTLQMQITSLSHIQALESDLQNLNTEINTLTEQLDDDALTQMMLDEIDQDAQTLNSQYAAYLEANTAEYVITAYNLTANQPFSPVAVALTTAPYFAWAIGNPASLGLETLAESGSPVDFLAAFPESTQTAQGDGILAPGVSTQITLSTQWDTDLSLTIATMFVNTNDAFTGANAHAIHTLNIDESMTFTAPIYDAGTEFNDELATTIPGPAGGGEGVNSERENHNIVTRHPGVVTADDGYAQSALDQSHRFDNNSMKVNVMRVR